jgi:hypothetical protein
MSTEARELELVGKVEMRIALAKDDKLESILKPYLPPLLLKLGSEHAAVRNKVRPPATLSNTRINFAEVDITRSYQHVNISKFGSLETSKSKKLQWSSS